MLYRIALFNSRRFVRSFAAIATVAAVFGVSSAALHADERGAKNWPALVDASYKITFNGFNIGSFRFRSQVGPSGYRLDGDAEISALLGVINWRAITRTSGRLTAKSPKPASYNFNFRSNDKSGSVRMAFNKGRISDVALIGIPGKEAGEIPVKSHHLKSVMDPMTAVMALARGKHGIKSNPCKRKLPIFDGKQRFDLKLTYRRQEAIREANESGQPSVAIVCGVRYVPIAGFKPDSGTTQMAGNDGIEIAMRPIPSADLFIPYEIRIPTIAGTVALTSDTVNITTQTAKQIALVH